MKTALRRVLYKLPVIRQVKEMTQRLAWLNDEVFTVGRICRDLAIAYLQNSDQTGCNLVRYEAQVNSQNGEDGIVAEIFRRIGTTDRQFVEFGVGNGSENNTAFLFAQGWKGWWFDGNDDLKSSELVRSAIKTDRLKVMQMFVTAENVKKALTQSGIPNEFDFLSIDLDLNTWHIWSALIELRPRLVCVEYNGHIPPQVDYIVPYKADAWWDGSARFGASLKAFENLGKKGGYSLVYCDLSGTNAFFVRNDLNLDMFVQPYTAEAKFKRIRPWIAGQWGHRRAML